MMQTPPYINKNSTFGIVAPSGIVDPVYIQQCSDYLINMGYQCKIGDHVFDREGIFAGTDTNRQFDFQSMIDDSEIDVILCARGGYGAVRTLEGIQLENFLQNPKWIIGYSDVTFVHQLLQYHQVYSIHGVMCSGFFMDEQLSDSATILLDALHGSGVQQTVENHNLNRYGSVEAPIVGGNLSIIYSAMGTPYDIDTEGKILYIEDLCEYTYHLDRMMMSLKTAGKLNSLAGLIVGQMSDFKEGSTNFGKTPYEVIADVVSDYKYPICFDFPIGHVGLNIPVKNGMLTRMEISAHGVNYSQD